MKIEVKGKIIHLEEGEEVLDMYKLVCSNCGHGLGDHAHTYSFGNLRTWITSQCTRCGLTENKKDFKCPQFRVE